MAKTDWDLHRRNYLSAKENEGLTVKQYAERHGLNPHSTRRELNKPLNSDQNSEVITTKAGKTRDQNSEIRDQKSDQKPDHTPKRTNKKQADPNAAKPTGNVVSINNRDLVRDPTATPRKKTAPFSGQDKNFPEITNAKVINPSRGENGKASKPKGKPRGKAFERGNDASLKTGGRATPRVIDYEKAVFDAGYYSVDDLTQLSIIEAMAHMNRVRDAVEAAVETLDEEIANADVPTGGDDEGGEQFGPHPTIKKAKFLMDAGYLFNAYQQTTSSISVSLKRQALDREKATLNSRKVENVLKESEVILAAIDLREKHGWDDVKTVEYIESRGVKPPPSMLARALKTIADMAPQVDDTIAYDEEDLDRQAREYAAKKASTADFIEQRNAEVAAMVDRLGLGDYEESGERRAGEFDADVESLDIDHALAREMYGGEYEGRENYNEDDDDEGPIPLGPEDAE